MSSILECNVGGDKIVVAGKTAAAIIVNYRSGAHLHGAATEDPIHFTDSKTTIGFGRKGRTLEAVEGMAWIGGAMYCVVGIAPAMG